MTQDEFWALISLLDSERIDEECEEGEDDPVTAPLVRALSERSREDIRGFDDILSGLLYELDGQEFAWHAGVCGQFESLFLYCRSVAVASGRERYESIVGDPSLMPTDMEFEPLVTVAERAWFKKTGEEYDHTPAFSMEMYANRMNWPD